MLRILSTLRTLSLDMTPSHNQTVRWRRRKPLWLGTAKSKLFRVPVRQVIPPEEVSEIQRLYNNYRTHIKSVRRFLTYKHSVLLQAKADTEALRLAFEEDFARCKQLNDQWNRDVNAAREERVAQQLEVDVQYARDRKEARILKRERQLQEAEDIVRREKEAAASFITPENLDAAIEIALNNPADYNYAIDEEGVRIVGRETKVAAQNS